MNGTHDTSGTATAGNGGGLDPQQAAALLEQTTRQARRQLAPAPPWLLVTRGVLALGALGTVWLSVRGQHPYQGPSGVAIGIVVAFGVLNTIATLAVAKRATTGVSGKSRLSQGEIAILMVAWVVAFMGLGVLASAGVNPGITYGWYVISVPLIVAGLAWAGVMAARENWLSFGVGLAVAIVGAVGVIAGPAGSWLVAGVGLCAVLLGYAAVVARRQRA